jgi:DNA-binding NarL/FixJ family response regulator
VSVVETPTGVRSGRRRLKALLVDDHQLLAQSLSLALEMEGVLCEVADLHDREALLSDVRSDPPDVVVLDLDLGDALGDGADLVGPLAEAGTRVLVVTASTDDDQLCRALERGAIGVASKSVPFAELLEAVVTAAQGAQVMSAAERSGIRERAHRVRSRRADQLLPFERLTPKEMGVLRALAAGKSVGCIASEWFVSEATVRSQVRGVLTKLGVSSQLEAVAQAHSSGWLAAP